jgi:hypothetical protein
MDRTLHVSSHFLATMTALAGLLASFASTAPARASCVAARTSPSIARLPGAWRAAVDDLIRSTAEPGHPWSCSGGTIDLELVAKGALLRVARDGEGAVWRPIASPEEVLPLGQALLATPLSPSSADEEHATIAPRPDQMEPKPPQEPPLAPLARREVAPPTTAEGAPSSGKPSLRLLLGGGVDARYVGDSRVAWVGPTLTAGVLMGRWLPSISLRQQSTILADGPSIDELAVAVAVQSRFEISAFELRAGLVLRGASVHRDLPRRRGEQSRLEGRIGAVTAVAIPMFYWGSVVLSADAEVVGVSRETTEPASTGGEVPTAFPTYTVGGSACFEVSL